MAYSVTGDGAYLVCDTGWVSHLEHMLEIKSVAGFFETLAGHFSVVRFDKLGCGLSDKPDRAVTFDDQVSTLLAVAASVGAERFHLFGASQGGQVAAAVAAQHPDRVMDLIVYGTCARGRDLGPADVRSSLVAMVRAHWGLGSQLMISIFQPDATPAEIKVLNQLQRWSASSDAAADLLADYYETDISSMLPRIQAHTLVLHRQDDKATRFRLGREVASLIPNATFVPLLGTEHIFWMGDWQSVAGAILEFLPRASGTPLVRLTSRESEVAALVAEGLTNEQIGKELFIAPRTAEAHLENIRQKLGVRSRAQVAAWVTSQKSHAKQA